MTNTLVWPKYILVWPPYHTARSIKVWPPYHTANPRSERDKRVCNLQSEQTIWQNEENLWLRLALVAIKPLESILSNLFSIDQKSVWFTFDDQWPQAKETCARWVKPYDIHKDCYDIRCNVKLQLAIQV